MIILRIIFGLCIVPFIAVWMWVCFPQNIMRRWAEEMERGGIDAYILYYGLSVLATIGAATILQLALRP